MSAPDAVVFDQDPNAEHAKILQAKTRTAQSCWELGVRLLRFKETGEWKNVTLGGPYTDFKRDYLERGCNIPGAQGYKYMRAAWFPLTAALQFGCDKLAMLKGITEYTMDDESPEAALELQLPTEDGGFKAFKEMSQDEIQAALKLVREEAGAPRRGGNPARVPSGQADALARDLRNASGGILKPSQVIARKLGGNDVIDLKGIPVEKVSELFALLASAMQKH